MNNSEIKTWLPKQEFEFLEELNKSMNAAVRKHVLKHYDWPKKRVSPQDGGCWYCETEDDDLVYDCEFDTMVHTKCIEEALQRNPDDAEAKFLKYLLNDDKECCIQLI